jgi:hypothetical protein
MDEKVMEFQKFLERELGTELDKIIGKGSISPSDICTMKDAFKLMKLIGEYDDMGYSTRRGRSRTTGRYVSRDSYGSYDGSYDGSFGSYDGMSRRSYERSGHTQLVSELERMYEQAHDEKERRMIEEWIRRAEQN